MTLTGHARMLADDPDLTPLWRAVHARLCAGEAADSIATVRVLGLSRAGIAALRSSLDRTARRRRGGSAVNVTAESAVVPLRKLIEVLRIPANLIPVLVEQAVGLPVIDRSVAQRAIAAQKEDLWAYASRRLSQVPHLVARMRAAGVGVDSCEIQRLVNALAAALGMLPVTPPVTLAKLAHDTAGDPHYFDLDALAGSRLVAAVAEILHRPEPSRPDLTRALLAEAGVLADRLSATVLLLHVDVLGAGPVDQRLCASRTPVALTLLNLTETPPVLAPQTLTIVENPSVLEAAMAGGHRLPLACTSGQLRAVDHVLLQLAVNCGVRLRYAGDLDRTGFYIADTVVRHYGAELVAMDAATVHAAAQDPSHVALDGPVTAGANDVAEALNDHGRVVFQEHDEVLRQLFDGLF